MAGLKAQAVRALEQIKVAVTLHGMCRLEAQRGGPSVQNRKHSAKKAADIPRMPKVQALSLISTRAGRTSSSPGQDSHASPPLLRQKKKVVPTPTTL